MRISLEQKIIAGFVINTLIAIALGWTALKRLQNQNDLKELEADRDKVTISVSKILTTLSSDDDYAKSYVLTGDDRYRDGATAGRYEMEGELQLLRVLFESNDSQTKRVETLEKRITRKLQNIDDYIEFRKYKNFDSARAFVAQQESAVPDTIKIVAASLVNAENEAFKKTSLEKEGLEKFYKIAYTILFFSLLILLVVVYFIIRHQLKAKKASEQLLETNNQLMRSVLDNTNNIIFIKKLNGQYLLVNREVENMFGLTKERWLGRTDADIFPKEVAASLVVGDMDVIKDKKEIKFEEKLFYKGEARNFLFVKFPVWDADRNLHAIGGIATDVTERSKVDVLLRESEAESQAIFNLAPDAIIVINEEGRIIRWNNRSENVFGYSAFEVVGKQVQEIIAPEKSREHLLGEIRQFVDKKEGTVINKTLEMTGVNRKGLEFDMELSVSPARVREKDIFIVFIRDITERKRLQKNVEEAGKFLNSIIEHIPSIILIKDARDIRFSLINKAAEARLGFKREEVIGKTIYDLLPGKEADVDANQDREVLTKGEPLDIPEELNETKAGKTWLHTKKIPIKDESGKPVYLLEVSENITEQKVLEEKKKETEKLLQQNVQRVKMILENIGEGVIVVDRFGEIILTNHMAAEIVGIREEDTVYIPVDWAKEFDLFYPEDNTIFPAQFLPLEKALLRGEPTDNLELIIQDPVTKERKYVVVNGRPIADETGHVIAAVTTLRDITKFTELQESLKTSETKYRDLIGFKTPASKKSDDEPKK